MMGQMVRKSVHSKYFGIWQSRAVFLIILKTRNIIMLSTILHNNNVMVRQCSVEVYMLMEMYICMAEKVKKKGKIPLFNITDMKQKSSLHFVTLSSNSPWKITLFTLLLLVLPNLHLGSTIKSNSGLEMTWTWTMVRGTSRRWLTSCSCRNYQPDTLFQQM